MDQRKLAIEIFNALPKGSCLKVKINDYKKGHLQVRLARWTNMNALSILGAIEVIVKILPKGTTISSIYVRNGWFALNIAQMGTESPQLDKLKFNLQNS